MLIHEVCKRCGLTRKAVEYYEGKELVKTRVLENKYREFSETDVERLEKIAILRKLGLSIEEIRVVLTDGISALQKVINKNTRQIENLKAKLELAEKLVQNQDWDAARCQLEVLDIKASILERMTDVFPGYYGKFMSLHFAAYLKEPIVTKGQQEAFRTIVDFLDHANFQIPIELQEYIDEAAENLGGDFVNGLSHNMESVFGNTEQYIADNKEVLEQYLQFKQSEEYKNSPIYRYQQLLEEFNSVGGYYDIFIPAMKRLSKSYREYCLKMEKANEIFMESFSAYFHN